VLLSLTRDLFKLFV